MVSASIRTKRILRGELQSVTCTKLLGSSLEQNIDSLSYIQGIGASAAMTLTLKGAK